MSSDHDGNGVVCSYIRNGNNGASDNNGGICERHGTCSHVCIDSCTWSDRGHSTPPMETPKRLEILPKERLS